MKKHFFVSVVVFLAFLVCIFVLIRGKMNRSSIDQQTATFNSLKDAVLSCTLSVEQIGEKQRKQIQLIVDIVNTGEKKLSILEPKAGVSLFYMYRKKNTDSFYSLLLPGIYSMPKVKLLFPNSQIRHERIMGMDPGDYEIYAEYVAYKSETQSTWAGKIRSNLVSISVR